MCLGVPGRLLEIGALGIGRAAVGSIEVPVNLLLTPEATRGDFVMIHAGTALEVMDPTAAAASAELLREAHGREAAAERLIQEIATLSVALRPVVLMEVCGTHTTAIARSGLKQRLPEDVELISGPGCPVCVTPTGEINVALELAQTGKAKITTFGDMLRVPGSLSDLEAARSRGADVQVVYSPNQAVDIAKAAPGEVVFLAVGFETTAPLIAAAVKRAVAEKVDNFSVLVNHRLVPPALEALLGDPESKIDGLLCPGHVSTVIGAAAYEPLVRDFGLPCVVAGFETLDVLEAIAMLLRRLRSGQPGVDNQYSRTVAYQGSPGAQKEIAEVFEVVDGAWRGLGTIENSALALRVKYRRYDAARRFNLKAVDVPEPPGCRCGAILGGRSKPGDCSLLGTACLPEHPVGPCMVSSEGSCRAAYVYG